jgi:hypothetical protein
MHFKVGHRFFPFNGYLGGPPDDVRQSYPVSNCMYLPPQWAFFEKIVSHVCHLSQKTKQYEHIDFGWLN